MKSLFIFGLFLLLSLNTAEGHDDRDHHHRHHRFNFSECPTPDNSLCNIGMHLALDVCFRKLEQKTVERADVECTTFGNYMLYVETIVSFYVGVPSVRCHRLGKGPFLIDAMRRNNHSWTSLDGNFPVDFSDFPSFDNTSCWDGAVLAWYPEKNSSNWNYGKLKCHNRGELFDTLCINTIQLSNGIGCSDENTAYIGEPDSFDIGNPILTPTKPTIKECQQACFVLPHCFFWTYHTDTKSCEYFYSIDGTVENSQATSAAWDCIF